MQKIAVCLVAAFLCLSGSQAMAETLRFMIQNSTGRVLHMKFFAGTYGVWPNDSEVWVMRGEGPYEQYLSCSYGEKICFGASPSGSTGTYETYWGVGLRNEQGCSNCCYVCNGGTARINLR